MTKEQIYFICKSLVNIVNEEGSTYGYKEEIEMAEKFINKYEKKGLVQYDKGTNK